MKLLGNEWLIAGRPDPDWREIEGTEPLDPDDQESEDGTDADRAEFLRVTGVDTKKLCETYGKVRDEEDQDSDVTADDE